MHLLLELFLFGVLFGAVIRLTYEVGKLRKQINKKSYNEYYVK